MKLRQGCAYILCTSILLVTVTTATKMTVVQVFDADSCTGVPHQIVFTPTNDCSNMTSQGGCSYETKDMGIFAAGNCTDDPRAFAAATYNDSSFVLVEHYAIDTNCSSLMGVAAYRADRDCHRTIDANISVWVNWKDILPSFNLYDDSSCNSLPIFQYKFSDNSDECVDGSFKLIAVH